MIDLNAEFTAFHKIVETIPNIPTYKRLLGEYHEKDLTFVAGSTQNPLLCESERIFLPRFLLPEIDPRTKTIIPDQDLQVAFLYFYQIDQPNPRPIEWEAQLLVQPTNPGILETRALFFLCQRSILIGPEQYDFRQTVAVNKFSAGSYQIGHFIAHDIEQKSPLLLVKLAQGLATIYTAGVKS